MPEDFKPGEIVVCLGLPDSYLFADDRLPKLSAQLAEYAERFKEGTEVRILKKLVSGNYFVERFHPPLYRVRLSPENLKRKEGGVRDFNLAGIETEGGFRRTDHTEFAVHHKIAFKSEVALVPL